MDSATIGRRINFARLRANLTAAQLADVLGVHRNSVGNWERGKTAPPGDVVARMAVMFGMTADQLLGLAPLEGSAAHKAPPSRRPQKRRSSP